MGTESIEKHIGGSDKIEEYRHNILKRKHFLKHTLMFGNGILAFTSSFMIKMKMCVRNRRLNDCSRCILLVKTLEWKYQASAFFLRLLYTPIFLIIHLLFPLDKNQFYKNHETLFKHIPYGHLYFFVFIDKS